jgi:hypothetical protein
MDCAVETGRHKLSAFVKIGDYVYFFLKEKRIDTDEDKDIKVLPDFSFRNMNKI